MLRQIFSQMANQTNLYKKRQMNTNTVILSKNTVNINYVLARTPSIYY